MYVSFAFFHFLTPKGLKLPRLAFSLLSTGMMSFTSFFSDLDYKTNPPHPVMPKTEPGPLPTC